jgi:hypothetical protein
MTIEARPGLVPVDGSSLISLSGLPNRVVYWALSNSTGTLVPINQRTDSQGRAAAVFTPGGADEGLNSLITVSYGS